ncbi:hypothetical protein GYMLUDRAFT_510034 [Collybiopsis luxurians FD-317 M1]|nr:hypothetical protein GYMLUDRAFT_510034 [Collybiopsis luxurians FD-317 M1]
MYTLVYPPSRRVYLSATAITKCSGHPPGASPPFSPYSNDFTSHMELPIELYRPIVGYIRDRPTLFSLLHCSRHLNAEAERSLYYKFENIHNTRTQVLFLKRAVDCPRVAELVYSYRFEVDWRTNFSEDHIFWELLPKALRAFVNLKILQFRTNGGGPVKGLLDGCTFQLEHCHWRCHSDELQMQSFLPTQRKLKSLTLGGWDDTRFSAPSNHTEQPDFRELAGGYGVVRLTFLCELVPNFLMAIVY